MIQIKKLLSYVPKQHGEHGVDATLHGAASESKKAHEVFVNPPGASWNHSDVLRPSNGKIYRWDHVPRRPPRARRPDHVLQINEGNCIHFLLIESKQSATEAAEDMPATLKNFFVGSGGYVGLRDRPAWHLSDDGKKWTVIPPNDQNRYWLKSYDQEKLRFWTGFAFSRNPEHYDSISNIPRDRAQEMILHNTRFDVVMSVGWVGPYHFPWISWTSSMDFKESVLWRVLDEMFNATNAAVEVEIE